MPIVPREAFERAHELSGNGWKVVSNLYKHRNIVTGQCNPSHQTISRESGVEITGVSVAKKELREGGWIETRGKRDVVILVGVAELEEARASYLLKIQISEALKFGKSKDARALLEAFFGKPKDAKADLGISPAASWDHPKTLRNSSEIENAAAAATAAAVFDPHAWKQETVTTQFIDELVTRGMFSREIVQAAWNELAFAVAQRGPEARATKGELMGFCRAKQKTYLPGTSGPYVARLPGDVAAPPAPKCEPTCPLCFGSQMQVVEGQAKRCPNRRAAAG